MAVTSIEDQLRQLLGEVLHIGARAQALRVDTPLLGALPELDSMGVVALVTAFEDRLGFSVDDDEIDGTVFQTFGTLLDFVRAKMGT